MKTLGLLQLRQRPAPQCARLLFAVALCAVVQSITSNGRRPLMRRRPPRFTRLGHLTRRKPSGGQDETAKALGVSKDMKVDLGGGVAIEFILIPAGKYMMGDAPGRRDHRQAVLHGQVPGNSGAVRAGHGKEPE